MDNRINEIRRKISLLRARMIELEGLARGQAGQNIDCSEAANEQLAARREIARLPSVVEAQPEIRFLAEVRYGDRSIVASVSGLAPSAQENESFDNMRGRGTSYGVPALAGLVLPLKAARNISINRAKVQSCRLKPGLHTLCQACVFHLRARPILFAGLSPQCSFAA